jgi:hypothetical protein|nr:MAG TPA: hypothetical protein [Caudoviricetes sp.]
MENTVNYGLDLVNYLRKENDPLFKDGYLYLYSDSKSEDYSDEVIDAFTDILIKENGLGSLEEMADRMYKSRMITFCLEVQKYLCLSFEPVKQYIHVYYTYDEFTDEKIELNDFEIQCNELYGNLRVLFKRIGDAIYQKTGLYCIENYHSLTSKWFISLSKYASNPFSLEMNKSILLSDTDTNGYVVKIENEKGELFLPSYETVAVDFDYIAPTRAVYVSESSDAIGFSFRKTGMVHTQLFRNPTTITSYLDSLEYTGRIVITKQDITKLSRHTDVVTNDTINVDYVEEGNSDNTIYDGIYSKETKEELLNILSQNVVYDIGPLPGQYINNSVLFNIGTDAIYRKDEIFEAVKEIAKQHASKQLDGCKQQDGFIDFKGTRLVDFKGELITVAELLDRISEKEFLHLLNTYAYNYNNGIINISREHLNNGNIVYYNNDRLYGRQFNKFYEDNVHEDKLEKLSSAEREEFIKNHPTVYTIRMVKRNRNIVRVEVDDNGNRIAGFKKCDLIITSKGVLGEYLHDIRNVGFGGGYDSNVNHYGAAINLSIESKQDGTVEPYDIYHHKETGQYFIARKSNSFHYPIPLNFKFD